VGDAESGDDRDAGATIAAFTAAEADQRCKLCDAARCRADQADRSKASSQSTFRFKSRPYLPIATADESVV
jgi:hypothetical protein